MTDTFDANYRYFELVRADLLKDPLKRGRFVIICNETVQAIYDTFHAAVVVAVQQFPVEEFIVQQVIPETEINGSFGFRVV